MAWKLTKVVLLLVALLPGVALWAGQAHLPDVSEDRDHDGLADSFEDALLARFSPTFMVSQTDCSAVPAQFAPADKIPTVIADDGTIYGQAFPRKGHTNQIELHYYHLWRRDCGEMGHALDAEHVSALITVGGVRNIGESDPDKINLESAHVLYWYAASHEDTICDASHIARAATVGAEDHGATVWISEGKHASFLSEELCKHGCGGDRCEQMEKLNVRAIVNLGESNAPMNDIAWLHFAAWPLEAKLERSDFTESRLQRVNSLPQTDVVWANPSKRPAQATILGLNQGLGGAATGARATNTALVLADSDTGTALGLATDKTSRALKTSSRDVWASLKTSAQKTGDFLNHGADK